MTSNTQGPRMGFLGALSASAVRRGVTFTMAYLIVFGFGLFSLKRPTANHLSPFNAGILRNVIEVCH